MQRIILSLCVSALLFAATPELLAQRGRGGGGGGGGGGARGGAGGGGARPGGGAGGGSRPSGFTAPAHTTTTRSTTTGASSRGTGTAQSTRTSGAGPNGGSFQSGSGSGSHTTKNGGSVDYKGAAVGGTTAGGVSGGRYVGGVQVNTAGGQTVNKVGAGGAASGPGGYTVGGRAGATTTSGPAGSAATASRSGFATGPGGTVAGGGRVSAGPNGASASRWGAASTPNGVAAGRTTAAVSSKGTYYRSATAVSGQGAYVRAGAVSHYNCFTPAWNAQYPGAWHAAAWGTTVAWQAATWGAIAASGGYPAQPVNYDYGSSVVYQDGTVYQNGDAVGTEAEYAQQATEIAQTGKSADAPSDDNWTPLGVFAMVRGEEQTSDNLFQLAVNKDGILRGNYYNALTDSSQTVYGSVNKDTQRAAWTVGDQKTPVYEAGLSNLTADHTSMMVHYSPDRSQQFTLFRIEQPATGEGQ